MKNLKATIHLKEGCFVYGPLGTPEEASFFLEALEKANPSFVGVDTEFIRKNTYYPSLALVQIAFDNKVFLFDPLRFKNDFSFLLPLFKNNHIVKVFHASYQDLEIFYTLLGDLPNPIFDTQLGALYLGLGENSSYKDVVKTFFREEIDKTHQYIDWRRRPLSVEQLSYAARDSYFLTKLYPLMIKSLKKKGLESYIVEDHDYLIRYEQLITFPQEAWLKISHDSKDWRFLWILQDLACWRELKAQTLNYNVKRVMPDAILIALSSHPYKNQKALENYFMSHSLDQFDDFFIVYNTSFKERSIINHQNEERRAFLNAFLKLRRNFKKKQLLTNYMKERIRLCSVSLNLPSACIGTNSDIKKLFFEKPYGRSRLIEGWRSQYFKKDIDFIFDKVNLKPLQLIK